MFGIRSSVGFMIFLIVVRIGMPEVFHGLETTLLKFFGLLDNVLSTKPDGLFNMASVNSAIKSLNPQF